MNRILLLPMIGLLAACDIPPVQVPPASDTPTGIAYYRCDLVAVEVVGGENDLFVTVFGRETLRRRCLAGESIAAPANPPTESGPSLLGTPVAATAPAQPVTPPAATGPTPIAPVVSGRQAAPAAAPPPPAPTPAPGLLMTTPRSRL